MRCEQCNKLLKENTDGDKRYCQGHSLIETMNFENKTRESSKRKDAFNAKRR